MQIQGVRERDIGRQTHTHRQRDRGQRRVINSLLGLVITPAILDEPISRHEQEVVMMLPLVLMPVRLLQVGPLVVILLSTEVCFLYPALFVAALPLPNPLYTVTSLTEQGCLYQMRQAVVYGQFTGFSGDNFNRFFLPYVLNFRPQFLGQM